MTNYEGHLQLVRHTKARNHEKDTWIYDDGIL
jgi:hypothetical protein